MKQCPYCSELVQKDAKKCKHCGEWFENKALRLFKKSKNFLDKQRLQHQAKHIANQEQQIKIKVGQILNFLDSLEAKNYILFVHLEKKERLFTIVYVGGGARESVDVQIKDSHTIKIESYMPIDYKGHLGKLQSNDLGKNMYAVLYDLYERINNKTIRERPILRNQLKEESTYGYNSESEYKNAVDKVIDNMVSGNINRPNDFTLDTKFYYVERGNTFGPITGKKLISLVNNHQINKNCFVRQESEKGFEKRAYQIVELIKK
ncbi:zinc ribbon domain-containing protein [Muricauda sp. 334s03]|uniref:Zinc ribbon domain-containing protein n=1 Tax=Flagellimonas yonaguniensis TaxID=3031325 RepID=A0ABT5Y4S1_9FLAO|nr:zinc ribbon domain-containing protein [[Muricauda] yonaguniensis]MDF0718348.1 zinc ribbon domain-containing protein [[Muricauda] yonaguniensis]